MKSTEILAEVESVLAESEFEVVDVTTGGSRRGLVVRIFVDREEGITLEDCARLSRALGDHFDAHDVIQGQYVLEVSSPGIDRPLRKPGDFQRFAGEVVEVSTYEKIDGRHKHVGVLSGFDEERNEVLMETPEGNSLTLPRGAIRKAHLKRDPWQPTRLREKER